MDENTWRADQFLTDASPSHRFDFRVQQWQAVLRMKDNMQIDLGVKIARHRECITR
jgi:hypothetical protein